MTAYDQWMLLALIAFALTGLGIHAAGSLSQWLQARAPADGRSARGEAVAYSDDELGALDEKLREAELVIARARKALAGARRRRRP
jgi:hypothetical protein